MDGALEIDVEDRLIDPRTGAPVVGPWRTVAVVAPTCVEANALATATIVMGEGGRAWLDATGAAARLVAIDGKGAFRRFKDVLLAFPAERERWFTYRADVLHFHIQTWIEHTKIEVANPPPWGHVEEPEEPTEIARASPSGEAPGEILRRQARELLDEIPAAELPSALAFLTFLRIAPDWQVGMQGLILILVLGLRAGIDRLERRP